MVLLVPSKHPSSGEHFRQPALVELLACAVVQNHKVTERKCKSADVRALALEQLQPTRSVDALYP